MAHPPNNEPLTAAQQELAAKWHALPYRIVRDMLKGSYADAVRRYGVEELQGYGMVVLCRAARCWRENDAAQFKTYAWRAIQRKLFDAVVAFTRRPQTYALSSFGGKESNNGHGIDGEALNNCADPEAVMMLPREPDLEDKHLALHKAVRQLPRPARRLLILRFYCGWDCPRIGRALGMSRQCALENVNRSVVTLYRSLPREVRRALAK